MEKSRPAGNKAGPQCRSSSYSLDHHKARQQNSCDLGGGKGVQTDTLIDGRETSWVKIVVFWGASDCIELKLSSPCDKLSMLFSVSSQSSPGRSSVSMEDCLIACTGGSYCQETGLPQSQYPNILELLTHSDLDPASNLTDQAPSSGLQGAGVKDIIKNNGTKKEKKKEKRQWLCMKPMCIFVWPYERRNWKFLKLLSYYRFHTLLEGTAWKKSLLCCFCIFFVFSSNLSNV